MKFSAEDKFGEKDEKRKFANNFVVKNDYGIHLDTRCYMELEFQQMSKGVHFVAE